MSSRSLSREVWFNQLVQFRIDNYLGATDLVPIHKFSKELSLYKKRLKDLNKYVYDGIPIGYKEVNNVFGRCLYLSAEQYEATTEKKYAGSKLKPAECVIITAQ